jgi:choline dehydrogenase
MTAECDDIIVGAGSAGAVLAARLTEDPRRSLQLLEAGPDFPTREATPDGLLRQMVIGSAEFDWGYTALAVDGREVAVPRGKAVGGSSAVNGAIALRGVPADYDEWAALGNAAWSWERVLPFFRRLEDDRDAAGAFHSRGGPIPIRRAKRADLHPVQAAFVEACRALGFPPSADLNHPEATGVGPWPMNVRDGIRISTAISYLVPARRRPNLTLRPDCHVHRVLFDGPRAVGVEASYGGRVHQLFARRITLSAGALASPAILLRSGIGPRADCRALGITPLLDLPGVGANLTDHPQIGVNLRARPGVLEGTALLMQAALRYTAPGSAEANDMQACVFQFPDSDTVRLSVLLQRPRSRGRLTLASADPHAPPRIDFNFCEDPEDVRRLVEGMRLVWALARATPLARLLEREVTLDDGVVLPLERAAADLSTDAALAGYVRRGVSHFFHPVGTARMGPHGDPGAVVDQSCRVLGTENLRVVDASVMPTIPRANTNLTCMMIGEHVADGDLLANA